MEFQPFPVFAIGDSLSAHYQRVAKRQPRSGTVYALVLGMKKPTLAAVLLVAFAHLANAVNYNFVCIDEYAIIQLGDNSVTKKIEGDRDIDSNSSVFGSVLKGVDSDGKDLKLSTSKVTGYWDIETGVDRDGSSSYAGSQNTLSNAEFNAIATKALDASSYWAGVGGAATDFSALDGSGGLTLTGGGGISVYDSTTAFKLTSEAALTLKGDGTDYFIINVFSDQEFQISGHAKVVLDGINPNQVLFNVLGGDDKADAQIGGSDVLFAGTLLAPGRNVLVSQTHFHTFKSSGHPENVGGGGTGAPSTTAVSYFDELAIFKDKG